MTDTFQLTREQAQPYDDLFVPALFGQWAPQLVDCARVRTGQSVLDVACGTGVVARAARDVVGPGGRVVGVDLNPAMLAVAKEVRPELEWAQGNAEDLPFADAEFDVVVSSFGAMFAPDHQAVADELLRVCRPGGTIGMANFTPEGGVGEFFGVFAPYLPAPPPDALPPLLWGDEEHIRKLFGEGVASLELTRTWLVERSAGGPREYCDFYRETFGPAVAAYSGDPAGVAELDRDFLAFATRMNRGEPGGPSEYHYEYLLAVARKR